MATGQHFTFQHVTETTRLPSSPRPDPGADIEARHQKGRTALLGAANDGLHGTVQLLLDR